MSSRLTVKIVLAALSVLLTLLAAEAVLWIAGIDYSPMRVEDRRDDRAAHLFNTESFIYDPVLIWRPRPGSGVFNSHGFRGAELSAGKSAGSLRIATIGDSNTLGWQGVAGAHWPGDLEKLLRAEDDRHRVVNAGVWGYTSHQGIARLREVLPLGPDIVTISFGSNDAHPVAVPDRAFAGDAARLTAGGRLANRFRLGRLIAGAASRTSARTDLSSPPTHRVELEDYRANLREMISLARQAGAQPVLLTRPYLDSVPAPPRWKKLAPDYNAATLEIGAAEDVPVVDFYTLFKAREELFADESHFTAEGHQLAARILYDRLRPYLPPAPGE